MDKQSFLIVRLNIARCYVTTIAACVRPGRMTYTAGEAVAMKGMLRTIAEDGVSVTVSALRHFYALMRAAV